MKVGIVVPFSWSFWGAVVEHAELQASALQARGHDVRLVMANDPPGQFTRALHPRVGRHGSPPAHVIPVGRSVIVPANGSLPNICLSPRSMFRMRVVLERERFDVLHLHEPMTPSICVAALALATCPIVATHHASGELGWMKLGMRGWGFLMRRVDQRIAVSEQARASADRWIGGPWEVIPNGVLVPAQADPGQRDHTVTFVGTSRARACRCCCEPGPVSASAPARGCRWWARIRWRYGCCSRGFVSPTTGSTYAASFHRRS